MAMALREPPSLTLSIASPIPRLASLHSCARVPSLASCHRLPRLQRQRSCNSKFLSSIRASGASAAEAAGITFHVENTSITVPMSPAAARGVGKAIGGLLTTFKEKAKAERPRRWESMEFRHSEDGVFLELFCNPNAYANAFQAKILITVSDEKIKISSEGQLSAIKADIDQYAEAYV